MRPRGDGTSAAPREPALDGLRAVAVALVLLFHGGFSWMTGGYLGVSLFFTLSGFLITRLLLDELTATGTIRLGSFYARRARRLLPASLLCLAAVVIAGRAGAFSGFDHLRRDLLGALAQIYNWVQLGAGGSYAESIGASAGIRSPLDHYWSLAIEEQFYWLWPLVLLAGARLARRRRAATSDPGRAVIRLVVVAAVLAAVAAPLIARVWGPDAAYWATPARAAEILLGAAAAALQAAGRLQRVPTWLAPLGLLAVVAMSVLLPADRGFAYEGGLVVVGLVSATVLLALRRPSVTRTVLAWRPLVAVGTVSYGLYLFHWPVFVILDEARTGLAGAALFAAQLAVTVAVTLVSYRIIEQPVRRATWRPRRTLAGGLAASALTLAAISAAPAAAGEYWDTDEATADAVAIRPAGSLAPLVAVAAPPAADPASERPADAAGTTGHDQMVTPAAVAAAPSTTAPSPSRSVRILVVGDSTAEANGTGLAAWAAEHPGLAQVSVLAAGRCGMVRGGSIPGDAGGPDYLTRCEQLVGQDLEAQVRALQPDVVAIFVVARDSEPRQWDPADGVLAPPDPRYAARIDHDYRAVVATVVGAAPQAKVVWVRPPTIDPYWQDRGGAYLDAAGHELVDGIAAAHAAAMPDHVRVLDLRAWLEGQGYAGRQDMRPDGIHFTPEAARQVAEEWLGPELVATALS